MSFERITNKRSETKGILGFAPFIALIDIEMAESSAMVYAEYARQERLIKQKVCANSYIISRIL